MKANKNILAQQWAILPEGAAWVTQAYKAICGRTDLVAAKKRPERDIYGQELDRMRIESGVGIVPVRGVILSNADTIDRMFGFVNPQDVAEDMEAAKNGGAKMIILDVNSPGGTVAGTPELAFAVQKMNAEVPVFAYTDSVMASAAYYLSAGATQIYAAPSATVGSIGVILEHLDATEYFASLGLKFDLFTSGKYKGTGHPGVALTDEQESFLQDSVDSTALDFKSFVQMNRDVDDETMQGQWWDAKRAMGLGLVDDLKPRLQDVITMFQ